MTLSLKEQKIFLIYPVKTVKKWFKRNVYMFSKELKNLFIVIVEMSTIEKYVNLRGVNMLKDALKILCLTTVKQCILLQRLLVCNFML